ncbi:fluoride efflux transporter CrcB [Bradyrhizobium vignae]|uniref:fluoride efflux transporter CrcB n=1 Tax=Bradyrhizobium vignae TaxID=1549949 RepID=UPI003222209E
MGVGAEELSERGGTLVIHVTGSFLMGAFVGLFATKEDLSHLTVGMCGGFSLDRYYLIERGQTLASFVYIAPLVTLSVAALIAALRLARTFP